MNLTNPDAGSVAEQLANAPHRLVAHRGLSAPAA